MDIENYQEQGIEIFSLSGSILGGDSKELKEILFPHIDNPAVSKILLNLKEVQRIDSSILGVLIACFKATKERGAQFALCDLGKNMMWLIKMSELDNIFTTLKLFHTK